MDIEKTIVSCLDYLFNNKGRIHVMEYPLINDLIDRYRGKRIIELYDNGRLKYEYYRVNRRREGWDRRWHRNGQLWHECYRINGKEEGWDRIWHINGQLNYESYHANGVMEGYRAWYDNGQLYYESYHLKGKRKR